MNESGSLQLCYFPCSLREITTTSVGCSVSSGWDFWDELSNLLFDRGPLLCLVECRVQELYLYAVFLQSLAFSTLSRKALCTHKESTFPQLLALPLKRYSIDWLTFKCLTFLLSVTNAEEEILIRVNTEATEAQKHLSPIKIDAVH